MFSGLPAFNLDKSESLEKASGILVGNVEPPLLIQMISAGTICSPGRYAYCQENGRYHVLVYSMTESFNFPVADAVYDGRKGLHANRSHR